MTRPGVVRTHGTRTCYAMGLTGSDTKNGCRCEPCTAANTLDAKLRTVAAARNGGNLLVDAGKARDHVAWLRANLIGRRAIASYAGVDVSTVYRLTRGKAQVRSDIAERILALNLTTCQARYIDATTTRRLLDGLIADGWTRAAIAKALGYRSKALNITRYSTNASPATIAKVDALVRRVAPHTWTRVHDQVRAERERSDARAAAAERAHERDRARKRTTSAAA